MTLQRLSRLCELQRAAGVEVVRRELARLHLERAQSAANSAFGGRGPFEAQEGARVEALRGSGALLAWNAELTEPVGGFHRAAQWVREEAARLAGRA